MRILFYIIGLPCSAQVARAAKVLDANNHEVLIAYSDMSVRTKHKEMPDASWTQTIDISNYVPKNASAQSWVHVVNELKIDAVLLDSDEVLPGLFATNVAVFKFNQTGLVDLVQISSPTSKIDEINNMLRELGGLTGNVVSCNGQAPVLRLAMVSPVLPAKSGIASYTAALAPALEQHYEITLIDTTPEELRGSSLNSQERQKVRDMGWFLENASLFDRVVYQLGNSGFHVGMLDAISQIPGVVVLHDFFIGHYLWWEQDHRGNKLAYETLRDDHGLKALETSVHRSEHAIRSYPGNRRVFRDALRVIVHSSFARSLATNWYDLPVLEKVDIIKHLKSVTPAADTQGVRRQLGIGPEDFVVCSFGFIGPYKMPDRIIKAWSRSNLSAQPNCKLIFVGENHGGAYGDEVLAAIEGLANPSQVRITGFVPTQTFLDYLSVADLGIQLRQNSRGETSGAVLDAMSHGLPQIVNANGTFAELDINAVLTIPDNFEDATLIQAINQLYGDAELRSRMSTAAKRCVKEQHAPEVCAAQYRDVIERAYREGNIVKPHTARLFLDVTATHHSELKSGIERVALALSQALINLEPKLGMVTPVYLTKNDGRWVHCHATEFISQQLNIPRYLLKSGHIEPAAGDTLLTLDLAPTAFCEAAQDGLFERYRGRGVKQFSLVYDLLPVRMPDVFPPGSCDRHAQWLGVISTFDGSLCISAHVANDLKSWRAENGYKPNDYVISHFMLGADTGTFDSQSRRFKPQANSALRSLINRPRLTFLMVGTIEPRKGYLEVLDTFEALWERGFDFRLVIVGREGWAALPHHERRDIPHTLFRLNTHPEKYHRLIWISNADDRKLEQAYEQADCLIAASYDEGFGLPIIEAAQRGIPVIARDIPVFREVAPPSTTFFKKGGLADAVIWWRRPERQESSIFTHTWHDSATQVLEWLNVAVADTVSQPEQTGETSNLQRDIS